MGRTALLFTPKVKIVNHKNEKNFSLWYFLFLFTITRLPELYNHAVNSQKNWRKKWKWKRFKVFGDVLENHQNQADPFFSCKLPKDSEVFCLSQSYFDLIKTGMRKTATDFFCLRKLEERGKSFWDVAGLFISDDENKNLCGEVWGATNIVTFSIKDTKNSNRKSLPNENSAEYSWESLPETNVLQEKKQIDKLISDECRATLKRLADSRIKAKQKSLQDDQTKQDFYRDASDLLELTTNLVKSTSQIMIDESKDATVAEVVDVRNSLNQQESLLKLKLILIQY